MKRLAATLLALGLATAAVCASAQSAYGRYDGQYDDGYRGQYGDAYPGDAGDRGGYYDYARVIRVDPVLDGYRGTAAGYGDRHCRETTTAGGYYGDRREGYYPSRGGDYYGSDRGDTAGRSMATVAGGIIGAVLGSKVGGGSGRFAATAVGSMVGGIAGREIYDQSRQQRYAGTVRVCEPEPVGRGGYDDRYDGYRSGGANAYDVTYEYGGHRYTRRMDYHPGDRVRVRVEVSPQ